MRRRGDLKGVCLIYRYWASEASAFLIRSRPGCIEPGAAGSLGSSPKAPLDHPIPAKDKKRNGNREHRHSDRARYGQRIRYLVEMRDVTRVGTANSASHVS